MPFTPAGHCILLNSHYYYTPLPLRYFAYCCHWCRHAIALAIAISGFIWRRFRILRWLRAAAPACQALPAFTLLLFADTFSLPPLTLPPLLCWDSGSDILCLHWYWGHYWLHFYFSLTLAIITLRHYIRLLIYWYWYTIFISTLIYLLLIIDLEYLILTLLLRRTVYASAALSFSAAMTFEIGRRTLYTWMD